MKHCPEPTEAHDDKLYTYYYERKAIEEARRREAEGEHKSEIEREE
jgi:hypothetical protein